MASNFYLGFDFSTQQIKAILINEDCKVVHSDCVVFDNDLPHYGTRAGVHGSADGLRVSSPAAMWLEALDLLLHRLKNSPHGFANVRAVSTAAQQHGSVFWASGSEEILKHLDPSRTLHDQLKGSFARADSPVWMDSSTGPQCIALETAAGGPKSLCALSGSKAFHRFTGNQIAKIAEEEPEVYKASERISLVSSWAGSLFGGAYAGIDVSDGSGMNLLDIRTRDWDDGLLRSCGGALGGLREKLGPPVLTDTLQGPLSRYFCSRYGFPSDCVVVTSTGDNPSSLAGLGLRGGDVAVSLGTSDTVLVWMDKAATAPDLHVLINPLSPKDAFMGMLCFKNGSLTRERVRAATRTADWAAADALLASTPVGNNGQIGFYYDLPEILPNFPAGDHRFDANGETVTRFDAASELRAVLEHGCLAKKVHAEAIGFHATGRVVVTGGGSANAGLVQMLADVFVAPVHTLESPNSAALGAALRAASVSTGRPWSELSEILAKGSREAARPIEANVKIYQSMGKRYSELERRLAA